MSALVDAVAYLLARDAGALFDPAKSAELIAAVNVLETVEDEPAPLVNEQGGTG